MQSQVAVQLARRFSFWDGLGGKKHQGSVEIALEKHACHREHTVYSKKSCSSVLSRQEDAPRIIYCKHCLYVLWGGAGRPNNQAFF